MIEGERQGVGRGHRTRHVVCLVSFVVVFASAPTALLAGPHTILERYCVTCHSDDLRSGGTVPISLEGVDLTDVPAGAELWEKVIRKLRTGSMPPAGRPRPTDGSLDELAFWLESEIDRAAAATPNPGRTVPLHRLNRTEYRNAIRDLLALDIDASALVPADDQSYGFDNIAGVLKVSPTLLERYMHAAREISRLGGRCLFDGSDWRDVPNRLRSLPVSAP